MTQKQFSIGLKILKIKNNSIFPWIFNIIFVYLIIK